jgi:catechol 2,3-dioxygenase-like lactoylglutathione lyase family enzyme
MRDDPRVLAAASPVVFIPSTDLARSRSFYTDSLGMPVIEASDAGVVLDVQGTTVWLVLVGEEFHVQPFTIFGWRVEDLDATMAAMVDHGIEFLRYDGMGQDDAGVWTAPSGRRIAWFQDPDGNNLSLND